ncbi:hypothetical protein V8E51_018234 [Hyaloscypha variabilis]
MEPRAHPQFNSESHKRKRRKGFMACIACRDRKVGCDGKTPACSSCASRGSKCEYLPIRKMRGPGKNKRSVRNSEQRSSLQTQLQERGVLDNDENYSSSNLGLSAEIRDIPEIPVNLEISEEFMNLEALLQQSYPAFVHPENDILPLEHLKRAVKEEPESPEGFVPLISQDQIQHFFEITYDEITAVYPMFDLLTLKRLITEQHAVSNTDPAGNPARWAIINTWIAMGARFKMTPGPEDELDCVIKAYYRNAVLVLPDLILQRANKESIQALLLMAVFAEGAMDHASYVMLVTNAVRQIEFLAPRLAEVTDRCEIEACRHSLSFARLQDMKVADKYGMTQLLGSLVF